MDYAGIVLDESSILKDLTGATRQALTEWADSVPYRLAATATPAPNDIMELLTHAQWLGIMTVQEAQGTWMINDGKTAGHNPGGSNDMPSRDFWRWVRTWASIFRRPSDLGCPDPAGYDPPDYRTIEHFFDGPLITEDGRPLFSARRARRAAQGAQATMPEDGAAHRGACGRGAERAVGDLVRAERGGGGAGQHDSRRRQPTRIDAGIGQGSGACRLH